MKLIKTAVTIAVISTLSACGSGVSIPVAMPELPEACDTEYHNEIQGSYNGQILFESPAWFVTPKSCAWEVAMSVNSETDHNGNCQTGFEYESDLIAGSPDCADLFVSGYVDHNFLLIEDSPQWPVDLAFRTSKATDVFSIYAPGSVNVGGWESAFDGRGNVRVDQASGLSGWSGVLVMFSDQPFQEDNGSVDVEGYEND